MLYAFVAVCALAGLLFLIFAGRSLRRWRLIACSVHGLVGGCFLLAAVAAWLLGVSLLTYDRLTSEQLAAEITLARLGERHYRATVTYPSHRIEKFELRGDEWQVDARVLKWRGLANIAGFDSIYRLERLSGRYGDINKERTAERTVHSLNAPTQIDAWELARRYGEYLPWIDTLFGSATFLPMADGALFEVRVSQSGLISRPLNQAARDAIAGWK